MSDKSKAKWPDGMDCESFTLTGVSRGYVSVCGRKLVARAFGETPDVNFRARQICALPRMVNAIKSAAKWYEFWLTSDMCDCDSYGHVCGKLERSRELEELYAILRDINELPGEGEG